MSTSCGTGRAPRVDEPTVDPVAAYNDAQQKAALDALTDDLLADYIRTHLQSRGQPVGQA
jgi:hypothetical protein